MIGKVIVERWVSGLPVNQIPSSRYLEGLGNAIDSSLGEAFTLIEGAIGLLDGLAAYDELARPSIFHKQMVDLWLPLAERLTGLQPCE